MTLRGVSPHAGILPGLWLVTGVLTGLPALLLGSFAEDARARLRALLLVLAAGVALPTAGFIWTGTRRTLRVSLVASVLVLLLAGTARTVLGFHGHIGLAGTLLFGALAAAGAAVTAGWRLYREARTTTH